MLLLYCFLHIYIYVFFIRNKIIYNELRKKNSKSYIKKSKPGLFYQKYSEQISVPALLYNFFTIIYTLLFLVIGVILFFLDSKESYCIHLIISDVVLLGHCIIYIIYNLTIKEW